MAAKEAAMLKDRLLEALRAQLKANVEEEYLKTQISMQLETDDNKKMAIYKAYLEEQRQAERRAMLKPKKPLPRKEDILSCYGRSKRAASKRSSLQSHANDLSMNKDLDDELLDKTSNSSYLPQPSSALASHDKRKLYMKRHGTASSGNILTIHNKLNPKTVLHLTEEDELCTIQHSSTPQNLHLGARWPHLHKRDDDVASQGSMKSSLSVAESYALKSNL